MAKVPPHPVHQAAEVLDLGRARLGRHKVDRRNPPGCGNCGQPIDAHRCRHLAPCCPGRCPAEERTGPPAEVLDLASHRHAKATARLRPPAG